MTPEAASHHKYIYFHIIKYIENISVILSRIIFASYIQVMSSYVLHILLLDCKNKIYPRKTARARQRKQVTNVQYDVRPYSKSIGPE